MTDHAVSSSYPECQVYRIVQLAALFLLAESVHASIQFIVESNIFYQSERNLELEA